jgi:hypothetical protein
MGMNKNRCQFIFPFTRRRPRITVADMPRLRRPVADGLMYHALNRGNNRAAGENGDAFGKRLCQWSLR